MRRRILVAIIGVTVMATTVLTVPLAVITAHRRSDDAYRELERAAERTAALLSIAPGRNGEEIEFPKVPSDLHIAVYGPDGNRLAGVGPDRADAVTKKAKRIAVRSIDGAERVLADPFLVNEQRIAIVRVAEPVSETTNRTRHAVLLLVLFDLVAIGIAAAVGSFVAARLARPVRRLRDDAVRLGDGDFAVEARRSGITEIDETSSALSDTAGRLEAMLARERSFSADASHQLRTPLAALRLSVETELMDPRPDTERVLDEALTQIDRLEETITTLLAVARDRPPPRARLDVEHLVSEIHLRWDGRFEEAGRTLRCRRNGTVDVHVSVAVLDQILDVLIANGLEHGSGTVTVGLRDAAHGGLVVEVTDPGTIDRDPSALFIRRDPGATGHGVGLSLARSLAEAEGGRLVVATTSPTSFRLVLPDATAPGA
ncbi:MAG: HAMP domain-containing histidine kinase [Actinobacteria bacterium]|nr:HAMP domain-containing histidine kinase [Actinomycetota bacterium]